MKADMSFSTSGKMFVARILVSLKIIVYLIPLSSQGREKYSINRLIMRAFLSNAIDVISMGTGQ